MSDRWIDDLRRFGASRPSDELWSRIEERRPTPDGDRPLARAAIAVAVLTAFTATAVLTWRTLGRLEPSRAPLAGPTTSVSPGGPGTYVLRDVRLRDSWTLEYSVSWSRPDSFPGVHRCEFGIVDGDGRTVAAQTTYFYTVIPDERVHRWFLSPDIATQKRYLIPIPGQERTYELQSDGWEPRASCDDERLDVGEPYAWEFFDPEVQSVSWSPTEDGHYVNVLVRTRWLGPAAPGVVICGLTLEDAEGRILMRVDEWLWPGRDHEWPRSLLEGVIGTVIGFGPEHSVGSPTRDELERASISFDCRPV